MNVHDKGQKADRDRATLIISYRRMVKYFRVPRSRWLSDAELTRMPNSQLFQLCKDLYNTAPVKKAQKLARRLGLLPMPPRKESLLRRLRIEVLGWKALLGLKLMKRKRKRTLKMLKSPEARSA